MIPIKEYMSETDLDVEIYPLDIVKLKPDGCEFTCVSIGHDYGLVDFEDGLGNANGLTNDNTIRGFMDFYDTDYIELDNRRSTRVYRKNNRRNKVKVGTRFKVCGNEYIIGRVDDMTVTLISLSNGNRWSDNVYVNDLGNISKDEILKLVGSGYLSSTYVITEE
jgi:hypothetical protein